MSSENKKVELAAILDDIVPACGADTVPPLEEVSGLLACGVLPKGTYVFVSVTSNAITGKFITPDGEKMHFSICENGTSPVLNLNISGESCFFYMKRMDESPLPSIQISPLGRTLEDICLEKIKGRGNCRYMLPRPQIPAVSECSAIGFVINCEGGYLIEFRNNMVRLVLLTTYHLVVLHNTVLGEMDASIEEYVSMEDDRRRVISTGKLKLCNENTHKISILELSSSCLFRYDN